MKRLGLGIVLLLVLAACGGDAGGDAVVEPSGDGVFTVSSPDGRAALTLTAASLPDGISADDLQIDWSQGLSGEPGVPLVGVRLQPDGLALDQSASLRFELPDTASNQFMVAHISENGFEFIDAAIDSDAEHLSISAAIGHFSSVLVFIPDGLATIASTATPSHVSVDQTQLVESEVQIQPTSIDFWMPISFGVEKQWQLISFGDISVSQTSNAHHGTVQWPDATFGAKSWDPPFLIAQKTLDENAVHFAGSSTCREANSIDPSVHDVVDLSLTVAAKGPVVDRALFDFARAIGDVEATGAYAEGNAFKEAVGSSVKGSIVLLDSLESECTTLSTVTSSTPSTLPPVDDELVAVPPGMDPRAVVAHVEPVVTANGTRGFVVTFAQEWDGIPELYSIFFLLEFSDGVCSETGGVESHAKTNTDLGSANTSELDTGKVLVDTGCSLNTDPFDVFGRSGSQEESTSQARFLEFEAHVTRSDLEGAPGVEGHVVCDFADPVALAGGCTP